MYVCINIKSLPHIAWRLQLRSESWGITNKLIRRVRYETLSSSHQCSWEKISHILDVFTTHYIWYPIWYQIWYQIGYQI